MTKAAADRLGRRSNAMPVSEIDARQALRGAIERRDQAVEEAGASGVFDR